MTLVVAVLAGTLIGLSLGALGGGGSILAVPVLVYVLGQSPTQATTGSLVVVGVTSLVGAATAHRSGNTMLGRGVVFGVVAIGGAVGGAKLSAHVTESVLLAAFSVLMLLVGALMAYRQLPHRRKPPDRSDHAHAARARLDDPMITFSPTFACQCPQALKVLITATGVGLLTGFLGVGGGFLVVPALVLALGLPMELAVGTSLIVITLTSSAALAARAGLGVHPDWGLVLALTVASAPLALGIDYALFLVVRYRAARWGSGLPVRQAVAETMDTAGKAVLLSGATVLISLSAVMLVPSPSFRSMAGGIMLAVLFVLAATLTLLPLVLAKLDSRINKLSLPWSRSGEHRSAKFAAWGERLWKRPIAFGLASLIVLLALAAPVLGLKTAMPSIKVLPETASARVGYDLVKNAFGDGAPGTLQIVVKNSDAKAAGAVLARDSGIAGAMPAVPAADTSGYSLIQAVPTVDPSDPALGATVDRLRNQLPTSAKIGGAAVENLDLKTQLDDSTPLVIGVILALGFLLLLIALQAPLIALLGTLASLLSTGAAFGVARLVFQDGWGAGLLGFEPQGFLDAWAPVFFFAMIFAIAMDYTVFLLASAKEHYEHSGDPKEAMIGALAHSGRVIFAAGAVMVAVFFTFALSGPLPPKEMGIVLGVAVLLDAFLVRLVLLPVLLRLTGTAAWWSPAWLTRILPRIRFSHN